MKCSNCRNNVEKGWAYCPSCGMGIEKGRMFDDIFSRIKREFFSTDREMKSLEKEVEAFDLSPFFSRPRGRGFTLKIYKAGDRNPQIEVKTFGGVDKKELEKAVYSQLGVREPGVQELRKRAREIQMEEKRQSIGSPQLKYAEEPKTTVKSLGNSVVVDIELPGVRSVEDIRISEMENSIEVKAIIGDKAFFKILTKPPQFSLVQRTFGSGVLHLEFA